MFHNREFGGHVFPIQASPTKVGTTVMQNNRSIHIRALVALCLCAGLLSATASAASRVIDLNPLVDELCYVSCSWTVTVDAVESETVNYQVMIDAPAGLTVTVDPSSFTLEAGGSQELTVTADVIGLPLDVAVQAEILLLAEQPMILQESFDATDFPPTGWSADLVAGSTDFSWSRSTLSANSGPASARRRYDATGNQDDWLVTPAFQVELGMELRFFERAQAFFDYEYSGLLISTGSCDPADGDFVQIQEFNDSSATWRMVNHSLDTWAGQTACLGFRYTGNDAHTWYIDDVTVTEAVYEDFQIDVSVIPRSPVMTLEPMMLESTQFADRQEAQTLTIGNDGLVELDWSFQSSQAPAFVRPEPEATKSRHDSGAVSLLDQVAEGDLQMPIQTAGLAGNPVNCGAQPDIIIHDDGVSENGYSGNASTISEVIFVEPFEPAIYPAALQSVCLAFITQGPQTLEFEVVVFADDGTSGQPGTELGSVNASITGIDTGSGVPGNWARVDLSALNLTLESGRVFVGARWTPSSPNVFIASDESASTPRVGGYWFYDSGNVWETVESAYPNYRALMIRLIAPQACDLIDEIPWLSASPESGTVAIGDSSEVALMFDSTGLAEGVYEAELCLFSNDLDQPFSVLPVTLTVVAERQVGGTVSGLEGSGLVLQNNGGDDLSITANGSFVFAEPLMDGDDYSVTVFGQPTSPAQSCSVTNAAGTIGGADITNIQVDCSTDTFTVGGTVSGLEGSGLVLQNNGGDDLAVLADGAFTFASALVDLSDYGVTIDSQPAGPIQSCMVSNGSGTVSGQNVTDVVVQCSTEPAALALSIGNVDFGAVVIGQQGTASVTITSTGSGDLSISQITAPGQPFQLTGGSCLAKPLDLHPGESCDIEVSFMSEGVGAFESSFDIISNADSSPDSITVRGTAGSPIAVPVMGPLGLVLLALILGALAWRQLTGRSRFRRDSH